MLYTYRPEIMGQYFIQIALRKFNYEFLKDFILTKLKEKYTWLASTQIFLISFSFFQEFLTC